MCYSFPAGATPRTERIMNKTFAIFTDHGNVYRVSAKSEHAARLKAVGLVKYYEIVESVFEDDSEDADEEDD